MDLRVFYEIIVPLLEVEETALICISTPAGRFNFYTELTEIRDHTGQTLFNVLEAGMVCDECKGTDKAEDCKHVIGDRPEWKPQDTFDKVKAIYGTRKTLLKQETMGQVTDDENMAFRPTDLQAFFKKPALKEPHENTVTVYVAVDPNGGACGDGNGTGSETAVVSFFYSGANVVVRDSMRRLFLRPACARSSSRGSGMRRAAYAAFSSRTYAGTVIWCPFLTSSDSGASSFAQKCWNARLSTRVSSGSSVSGSGAGGAKNSYTRSSRKMQKYTRNSFKMFPVESLRQTWRKNSFSALAKDGSASFSISSQNRLRK